MFRNIILINDLRVNEFHQNEQPFNMFVWLHQISLNIQIQLQDYDRLWLVQLLDLLIFNLLLINHFFILAVSLRTHPIEELLISVHVPKLQRAIIFHALLYLIMKVLHTYLDGYQLKMELLLI